MSAKLIDGKAIAQAVREEIREAVARRAVKGCRPPGLGVILVGDNPASASYVRSKTRACAEAGFHSRQLDFPVTITQSDLHAAIAELNSDPLIDGILMQLPLPRHLDETLAISQIDPSKDVDGLHPVNAGNLATGRPGFVPCTPLGVVELLIRSGIETKGRHAVVVGRSNLVGKPLALLMMRKGPGGDATVTVCHSATRDLAAVTRSADILIAAIGVAHFVKADMVRPDAVVIDVGINSVDAPDRASGKRLVGDVDTEAVSRVTSYITPVPGGVGPMTIAMLLRNTLDSVERRAPSQ
jgi:methylenetetrahydrofolate dehydrogenase (NADP+)/methenyltetrahydrofolate cyclohydrolase